MKKLLITAKISIVSCLLITVKMPLVMAAPLSQSENSVTQEATLAQSCFSETQLQCQSWNIAQNIEIYSMSPEELTQDTPLQVEPETKPTPEIDSTTQVSDQSEDWHFKFQPYIILPVSIYGDASIKGRSISYHANLGDVFDALTFAISARFELWHDNFGLIVDAYYASLEGNGFKSYTSPRVNTSLKSSLQSSQGFYTLGLSYHLGDPAVYSLPETPSNKSFPQIWFEPIIGLRINNINATLDTELKLNNLDKTFSSSVSNGTTWLQPLVGGKFGLQVSDPVTFWVLSNVSGFGISGDTDLSWNIIAGLDWWVSHSISLQLGYTFDQVNYKNSNNGFKFEQNFNGPFLSATFNF